MTSTLIKRIALPVAMLVVVGGAVVASTGAFFSDTETSANNTFTAGAIDLKIDNHSYYNGLECDIETQKWVDPEGNAGNDPYLLSLIGTDCNLSWQLSDLDDGHFFFNFSDLKPGDWGEDTISLHVDSNSAWACAYVTKTSDEENSIVEPEEDLGDDAQEGELDNELTFIWWADDGDNVLEEGEKVLNEGDLGQAPVDHRHQIILADSNENIWAQDGDPLEPGDTVYYIGKAWCFGDLDVDGSTYAQDGLGGGNDNGPDVRQIDCDGSGVGNHSQTDSTMLDVSFYVEQSRNNSDFICGDNPVNPGIPDNITFFTEDFEDFEGGTPGAQSGSSAGEIIDNDIWDETGVVRAVNILGIEGETTVAAEFDAGGNTANNVETLETILTLDTTGYGSIDLMYDLLIDGVESGDSFTVGYSTDGGSNYTTVASYNADQGWTTHTDSLSTGADNQSNIKIRFQLTGTHVNDKVYLDNIKLTGVEL